MPEPIEPTGQEAQVAPEEGQPEFDPSSVEVEVAGRKMKVSDLQQSYAESEKRMRQMESENLNFKTELEKKKWADELQDLYNQNAEFKSHMDSFFSDSGQSTTQNVLHPDNQRLTAMEQQLIKQEQERAFDRIRQRGLPLDTDMETQVLREINVNPNVREVDAAYWKLFGEKVAEHRAEQAVSKTAGHIADNRDAVQPSVKGAAPQKKPGGLSEADVLKQLENLGY